MLRAKTRKMCLKVSWGEKKFARNRESERARTFETFLRHGREEKHTGNRQNTHFIPCEEKLAQNWKSYYPLVQLSAKINTEISSPQRVFGRQNSRAK